MAPWATDPSVGELLAAQWVAAHRPGRQVARARTHTVLYRGPDDVAARVGVRFVGDSSVEELTLLVHDSQGEVSVAEFPDDPFLPTLAGVLRGAVAEPLLGGMLPELAAGTSSSGYRAVVVHHPREGACVLRIEVAGVEVYAKVYPLAEDAIAAAASLDAMGAREVLVPGGDVVRLPRLLGASAALRTTFLESLTPPGVSDGRTADPLPVTPEEAARALRAFHAHTPLGRLPRLSAEAHVSRVRREQQLVATAWPDVAERVDGALSASASVLGVVDPGPLVLCHGDFTPGQLVRLPGAVGLLDLDTLSLGDAASDIGRFLAYEQVRSARLGRPPSRAAAAGAGFLDAYGQPSGERVHRVEGTDRVEPTEGTGRAERAAVRARVSAYRRLNLALLALRATRRFKPARAELAMTLLDAGRHDPVRRR